MKNIHVLPIEKPSRLYYWGGKIRLGDLTTAPKNLGLSNQNIYITNDEGIKESFRGWFIGRCGFYKKCVDTKIINNELYLLDYLGNTDRLIWCKKIIITTDQDLIKDGVQAIDDEFLEWFVNNPSCEYVEIQPDKVYNKNRDSILYYKIIIPKEEHKQECKVSFKDCFNSLDKCVCDIMKQETLEEVAINCWAKGAWDNRDDFTDGFVEGAKWQKEQLKNVYLDAYVDGSRAQAKLMYSEEEVLEILYKHTEDLLAGKKITLEEWFEQFKNK